MNNLFWALEFITSALVIVTLYLIGLSYKWWLAYAANSILFSAVALHNSMLWFALMGICLCVTAIRNYYIAKKKERDMFKEKCEDSEMNITKSINRGLWYFAHPYTCRDKNGNFVAIGEEANFNICNFRAAQLLKEGYNIYSPISHTHPIHRACPVFLARAEHELWYQLDNEVIDKTNWEGIILAPGWEKSSGCQAEKKRIEARGLRILFYIDIIK